MMDTFTAFWILVIAYAVITVAVVYSVKFYHYAVLVFRLLYNRNRIVITRINDSKWKDYFPQYQYPQGTILFKCQIHLANNKVLDWTVDQHGKCIQIDLDIPMSKRLLLVRNINHLNDQPHYFPARSWLVVGITRWLLNKLVEEPFVIAKLSSF